jgi:hypothetical protein
VGFEITWRADVFSGAPQESSAASFGTLGITFRAHKPREDQERLDAVRRTQACAVTPLPSQSPSSISSYDGK